MGGKMGAAPPPTGSYTVSTNYGLAQIYGQQVSQPPTPKKHQKLYDQIKLERERRIEAELEADKFKAYAVITGVISLVVGAVLALAIISDNTAITCAPERQIMTIKD